MPSGTSTQADFGCLVASYRVRPPGPSPLRPKPGAIWRDFGIATNDAGHVPRYGKPTVNFGPELDASSHVAGESAAGRSQGRPFSILLQYDHPAMSNNVPRNRSICSVGTRKFRFHSVNHVAAAQQQRGHPLLTQCVSPLVLPSTYHRSRGRFLKY